MGFLFNILTHLLHGVMKLEGLTPQTLEIDPDTLMNIWLPKEAIVKQLDGKGKPLYIPPKKPAVLLLHCFAMDGVFLWFPQILALTNEYSVYVPDLLFFGGSTTRRTKRSVRFQAEVLAKGMEMLGVQKVAVVGLSYGGMVAFEMAKLYPKLVHSMVVSSTVVELTESISRESLKRFDGSSWSDLLLPENVEGFKRMLSVGAHKLPWIPHSVYRGVFETMFNNRKERSELLTAMIVPDKEANTDANYSQGIKFGGWLREFSHGVSLDLYNHNAHLVVRSDKILLLWGDDDKIFNLEVANTLKTQLGANTVLEYIENAGHLLSMEQPFAYNRHLKHFLASSM